MFVSECVHVCVRVSALYMHFHMCAYLWSQRQSIYLTLHSIILDFFLFLCLYICDTCVGIHRGQKSGRQKLELQALVPANEGDRNESWVKCSSIHSILFSWDGSFSLNVGLQWDPLGYRYYTLTFLCGYCLSELKSSCFTASVLPTEPSP